MSVRVVAFVLPALVLAGGGIASAAPRYSDWSPGQPLTAVNTAELEFANGISKDGLTFYFQRGNAAIGGEDIWIVQRETTDAPWGPPQKLPASINSSANDRAAFESPDGHWLFFASDRPGGRGGFDLMVARRDHTHAGSPSFGWQDAMNIDTLGSPVNTPGFDSGPTAFEDDSGALQLYLVSNSTGPQNNSVDIYLSVQRHDGSFGPPTRDGDLSSLFNEGRPYVRHDGLELFFNSNRPPGSATEANIWVSTRATTTDRWSVPEIVPVVSTPANEITPVLSWDARTLFYASNRSGVTGEIYFSTREKVTGKP